MDSAYAAVLDVPFEEALTVLATVISTTDRWAVVDAGLKAFGMDHGNPSLSGADVMFCSDEHTVFSMCAGGQLPSVGDRLRMVPAHIDPTCALHERIILSARKTPCSRPGPWTFATGERSARDFFRS